MIDYSIELTEEYNLIAKICKEIEETYSVSFTKADMIYLAVILKGSKLQAADDLPYDRVVLGRKVKKPNPKCVFTATC